MKFFAKTDYGKVRQINQDYYVAENRRVGIFPNIFIVADGVGSNPESSFASKHCSDFVLSELSLTKDSMDYVGELGKAYRLANRDLVYRIMANPSYKGMGTTMVALTVINSYAIVANVGDSRCYHISNDRNHPEKSAIMAEQILTNFDFPEDTNKRVVNLVKNHGWFEQYNKGQISENILLKIL